MPFHILDPTYSVRVAELGRARVRAERRQLRFRMAVLGPTVSDVVIAAGGWICDRAMSGWDVTVATADHSGDPRALQILGATGIDLGCALNLHGRGPWPHALAVSATTYAGDEGVRAGVRDALKVGFPLVTMWGGESVPAELVERVDVVHHQVSRGAQLFKSHALGTLAAAEPGGDAEVFWSGELQIRTPWPTDLRSDSPTDIRRRGSGGTEKRLR